MAWKDESEIKRKTLISFGAKVEELLDGSERASSESRGAQKALSKHIENLMTIIAASDTAVGGKEEDSIPDLETLKLVKMWMGKMVLSTQNFSRHFRNIEQQAIGESNGHRTVHDILLKMIAKEKDKVKSIEEKIEVGEIAVNESGELEAKPGIRGRPLGVRPGRLKEQRNAEEKAKKKEQGKSSKEKKSENNKGKEKCQPQTEEQELGMRKGFA